jgi:cobalt-zinc-cadmium efflux system membrane fusion protein
MRRIWNGVSKAGLIGLLLGAAAGAAMALAWQRSRPVTHTDMSPVEPGMTQISPNAEPPIDSMVVELPRASWPAVSLRTEPVPQAAFAQSVELTGKIALNEDRVAHIFPLVDGRVDEVKIQLGDRVKKGDLLVVVQSTEVGRLMLQLFQDRLQRDFVITKDRWTQTVTANTQAMLDLIRGGATIEEIEEQLTDRPMGDYRDKLMTAYVAHYKARKNLDRLVPLSQDGTITGRQLLEAESDWNGARATLQSLIEQFQQEIQQAATVSKQSVKELETRVAVDETNLLILGFAEGAFQSIDPVAQGETISHYPIYSPFDGSIISKDVVLLERVGPQNQILSIADLSTVWVTTDIYEENLPLLAQLEGRSITLRSPAWPGKQFEARIFYTGDLVDEASRTVAMRAVADNPEGHLKPGMFVNVLLPGVPRNDVTQVPLTAVQEHEGKSFVFVQRADDRFERRDVRLGARNADSVEVLEGVTPGEVVVIDGGFALKSRMLSALLGE